MSVAVIVRAKNEMPHAQRALDMLHQQTFADIEIFAVDSGSTDGTLQTLETYSDHVEQIAPEAYVPGKVLNEAIARTSRKTIVLLNADAVPLSNVWMEKLLLPILENQADATFSRQIARPDARFIVAYDYERAYRTANPDLGFFSAVACAFRRSLWEKQPFPSKGYAEDAAWAKACTSAGARLRLVDDSVVEHSHNYTLKALYQKRYRQALTFNAVPNIGKQTMQCLREITRDLLHACSKAMPHTIPYNMAYRTTIHRATHQGLKDAQQAFNQ